MSNIENDAKQTVADVKTAVANERRGLVARLMNWLRDHPHTMLAIAAGAVIVAVAVGLAKH
ncbi:MAG TPA: hypothetical protein VKV32_15885 [Stellaceae bacterium]|nr:hypothetical protein [Stellaceae bacterium]